MSSHRNYSKMWRRRAYEILEHGSVDARAMRLTSGSIIVLILVNILAVVLESVPRYEAAYGRLFVAIEVVSLVVFTLEYALRIWAAPEHAAYRDLKQLRARLRYAMSSDGLIDLVSVLPFWVTFVAPSEPASSCCSGSCVSSSSPAIRQRCARCWKRSMGNGGRCSGAP